MGSNSTRIETIFRLLLELSRPGLGIKWKGRPLETGLRRWARTLETKCAWVIHDSEVVQMHSQCTSTSFPSVKKKGVILGRGGGGGGWERSGAGGNFLYMA